MTQFHEGQEVESSSYTLMDRQNHWRKAKIVYERITALTGERADTWMVEFRDGTRGVFDADPIRARRPILSVAECAERQWPLVR